MSELTELEAAAETAAAAAAKDRRRPGRLDEVSPELIPILRGAEPDAELEFDDVDQTAALRGLVAGVVFSAPIWVAIAYLGSWLLSK
ncbi:MAG: hypothetical protein M3N26_11220 [Pseudomonadota bacterium]|nr:hypothetical protein [Pseudomonadota bacterium]